jgi:hypothetical protein
VARELRSGPSFIRAACRMIGRQPSLGQGAGEMNDRKMNILLLVAVVTGLALLSSSGAAAGEAEAGLSSKHEDAFILYKYSLSDAKSSRASRISAGTEGNEVTYRYDGHALSCRTVMTGTITRTAEEGRTHVVGDFDVSNNSYGISQLSFDFYEAEEKTRTGSMLVDGEAVDLTHFDHR